MSFYEWAFYVGSFSFLSRKFMNKTHPHEMKTQIYDS